MSLDSFLSKSWSMDYTCYEFACDVYRHLTGIDIAKKLKKCMTNKKGLTEIKAPEKNCFILMSNGGSYTHIGVYVDKKVYHLSMNGAQMISLELMSKHFKSVRFFK